MKATEARLLDLLKKAPQFVIPIYQRTYSWTKKECRQLWDDIVRSGGDNTIAVHFVGSIVYIEQGLGGPGPVTVTVFSPLLVIDGQQRLTTVMLLIAALAKAMTGTEPVDGFSPLKLKNNYLCNRDETGERHYKLLLSQIDKASMNAIIDSIEQPKEFSLHVTENFQLFEELIAERNGDFVAVCNGLAKLVVVDIALNRSQDNPQLIFESMNSTGLDLNEADKIRNFILMGLDPQLQTRLYEQYWRPMEVDFGQKAYGTHFDDFIRHYLTLKTGEIPNIREIYPAFKAYAKLPDIANGGVELLVKKIRTFSRYFCAMAFGTESEPDLNNAFHDLRELKVEPAYPFLLELYHDYANGKLSKSDFVSAVRLVESYVFRRAICAIMPNSLNRTFASFSRVLKKDRYLESIEAHLLAMPSYRRFPGDEEFRRDLQTRDLYNFRSRSYWLRRLENHDRKERVAVAEYTIEHILPQNENLSAAWKAELGPEWKRVQETWLHTIGNLTLTGYNSSYSDKPFPDKRDMEDKGFRMSALKLNAGLGQLESWNEEAIQKRAGRLADLALKVWTSPKLSAQALASYQNPIIATICTITDHPRLLKGKLQEVFEAFRKEVLALDSCVYEEFLKICVAYKAETNFVDVEPQARRLLLTFNVTFSEMEDPKGLCRDVTDLGHQGNGDVQIGFATLDELPYVMGLVRQSYERQMGSGDS